MQGDVISARSHSGGARFLLSTSGMWLTHSDDTEYKMTGPALIMAFQGSVRM